AFAAGGQFGEGEQVVGGVGVGDGEREAADRVGHVVGGLRLGPVAAACSLDGVGGGADLVGGQRAGGAVERGQDVGVGGAGGEGGDHRQGFLAGGQVRAGGFAGDPR